MRSADTENAAAGLGAIPRLLALMSREASKLGASMILYAPPSWSV